MAPISAAKCPYFAAHSDKPEADKAKGSEKLALGALRPAKPINYTYAEEFKKLNVEELRAEVVQTVKNSQDWWPADYGHYGPFLVRLAWHSAGSYRSHDGRGGARGGNIRFPPLDSWPDNGNLDKAKRLLWPIKQKYGKSLSWGDLMIFAANVGMEDMGFPAMETPGGFAFGRQDIWALEEDIYWGSEEQWLDDSVRHGGIKPPVAGDLEKQLGASQMGLIYVNPQGPGGHPDPMLSAQHIRETFGRMAMNDEETVALIAGGHTFGKGHGAAPDSHHGPEPQMAKVEEQGFGWISSHGSGNGAHTITSGFEGAWTENPTQWDNGYFDTLFKYEWEQTTAPSGAIVWKPVGDAGANTVPDAHDSSKKSHPVMFTSDLAMRTDPAYKAISERWQKNPEELKVAFQKAWFKLCHRDMGVPERYLGPLVPKTTFLWQDIVPKGTPLSADQTSSIKAKILASGLTIGELARVAWGSAATFRQTDLRGGASGARIRLEPQKSWAVNNPAEVAKVISALEQVGGASIADLIVLGGCAAVEAAAKARSTDLAVVVSTGRGDSTQEQTDPVSFKDLEPVADGFRNYNHPSPHQLVDQASRMGLSTSEMTVLIGGLRALGVGTTDGLGSLTNQPGTLSNDFFVNLLDMRCKWHKAEWGVYEAKCRSAGSVVWKASEVDLVLGSNAELRAISEFYAQDNTDFCTDFAKAWVKVMDADRV